MRIGRVLILESGFYDALQLPLKASHTCLGNTNSISPKEIQIGAQIFKWNIWETSWLFRVTHVVTTKNIICRIEYCQDPKNQHKEQKQSCGWTSGWESSSTLKLNKASTLRKETTVMGTKATHWNKELSIRLHYVFYLQYSAMRRLLPVLQAWHPNPGIWCPSLTE